MPLYMVEGSDGPEGAVRRPAVRPAHLAHLRPYVEAGRVPWAGPILDSDGQTPRGSLIILEAENIDAARAVMDRDPYVTEGVFGAVTIRPVRQVVPEIK